MTTLEILIAARALIEKPENWTQRAAARNRLGNGVGALEPSAFAWCASGAIFSVCGRFGQGAHEKALAALRHRTHWSITSFNDRSSHDEVLRAFDEAIERERARCEPPTSG